MTVLQVRDAWFGYRGGSLVLRGVSLSVAAGETVALLGRNGAGKTTLTKLMVALHHPDRGEVRVAGVPTTGLAPEDVADRAAYVFQHADQQLFSTTVRAEVGFGPRQLGRGPADLAHDVDSALEQVGLDAHGDTHPYDLPAAGRKMVALAAALAQRPRLLVLDEPTQGLDRTGKTRVMGALQAFVHQGGAVVAVTHDLGFVAECLERAVVLDRGTVGVDEPARRLVADETRCRALGLVPPVAARVASGLRLHGAPVKIGDVVRAIRAISG